MRANERGELVPWAHTLGTIALMAACGGDPALFGGGGGDGGSTASSTGGAEGGAGGSGAIGGSGGVGGGTCDTGALRCEGDQLLVCEGGAYVVQTDCAATGAVCVAGRCEEGLRLLLRFDEGGGTATQDEGPEMLTGTLVGATWTTGHTGTAPAFTGVESVDLDDVLNDITLPFSIATWINVPAVGAQPMTIVATDGIEDYAGVWFRVNGPALELSFGNGLGSGTPNNRRTKLSDVGVTAGGWVHVAGVFADVTAASIYVDGVDVGGVYSAAATQLATSSAPFLIGRASGGAGFVGAIDDVRVYERALAPSEVVSLAEATR